MSSDNDTTITRTSTSSYISNNKSAFIDLANFPIINLDNINLTNTTTTCTDNFSALSLDNSSTKIKCKFGSKCSNSGCKYDHTVDNPSTTTTKTKCKFGSKCTNSGCKYDHTLENSTNTKCKFGSECNKSNCKYDHS